jgi:hypothetical protein
MTTGTGASSTRSFSGGDHRQRPVNLHVPVAIFHTVDRGAKPGASDRRIGWTSVARLMRMPRDARLRHRVQFFLRGLLADHGNTAGRLPRAFMPYSVAELSVP